MIRNEKIAITGGKQISGTISVSGSKNACLPIIAASLLATGDSVISNVPHLQDTTSMLALFNQLGAKVFLLDAMHIKINTDNLSDIELDFDLATSMRSSILMLGPLLARYGQVKIPLPGGCAIGSRPIDMHIKGLEAMGAKITIENNLINASTANGLIGTEYTFPSVSVTGTENLIMAATLAKGTTSLKNCAKEPEVVSLVHYLRDMGAKITGEETSEIKIVGSDFLQGQKYKVIADRIEAGTFLCAAVATGGSILLTDIDPKIMHSVTNTLENMGVEIQNNEQEHTIFLDARNKNMQAIDLVTSPYPGFPTDMQSQFCVLNCLLKGKASIHETVFENRFMYCKELRKMGAEITEDGNKIHTTGENKLTAAKVQATDLRASACLVIAALAAEGTSYISDVYHLDRGYEIIEEKLSRVGAEIARIQS